VSETIYEQGLRSGLVESACELQAQCYKTDLKCSVVGRQKAFNNRLGIRVIPVAYQEQELTVVPIRAAFQSYWIMDNQASE
jgi:hypothetical protein